MKKVILILSMCFCELCYSQEIRQIFLHVEEEIQYDESTIDETLKQILSIDSQITFDVFKEEISQDDGSTHLRMHQYMDDYRIMDADLLVHVKKNNIYLIDGTYYSSIGEIEKNTPLTKLELVQIAEKDVFGIDTYYDMEYKTEKVIAHNTLNPDDENLYYAYKVSIIDKNNLETAVDVIIDENSGKILQKSSFVYYSTSIIKMSDVKCLFTANPVKNKLYLTLPQVENEIKIFNIQGKLMLRQVVGQTAIINVQCLKSGTYVLIVNNTEKQKIVIN
mgnify:FL=1